jgi:catechol 2,3-dioxygenase-like lactoylglutathione lyase family enzyme
MSTQETSNEATERGRITTVDMKLEVVVIPVSDVDLAKDFYGGLGWRLDADFSFDNVSGSFSSRHAAPAARFNSEQTSRPLSTARLAAFT